MADPAGVEPGRRARKKARTRASIFAAANPLAAEHGFDTVTVEQICRVADIARGTFFLHFATKAALLAEASREFAEALRAARSQPRTSAATEYRMLLELLSKEWDRRGALLRPAFAALLGGSPALAKGELSELMTEMALHAQRRGELRRELEPHLAANLMLAGAVSLCDPSLVSKSRSREQVVSLVLGKELVAKPRLKWTPKNPVVRP